MEGKKDKNITSAQPTRICERCGEGKTLNKNQFYFKKDRCDYDKTCTTCRKKERTNRYKNKKDNQVQKFPVPQRPNPIPIPNSSTNGKKLEVDQDDFGDLVSFFETLREWRDDFKREKPEEFNKKWEVSDVL